MRLFALLISIKCALLSGCATTTKVVYLSPPEPMVVESDLGPAELYSGSQRPRGVSYRLPDLSEPIVVQLPPRRVTVIDGGEELTIVPCPEDRPPRSDAEWRGCVELENAHRDELWREATR